MKRGAFDTLRRSFDNTLANWPLVAIRVAEALLFVLLAVAAALAVLVPILVSVGIEVAQIQTPDDIESAVLALMQKWVLLIWIFVAILILSIVFVAIHSVVEAGSARVYIDGERVAGPAVEGPRARFRVFSMDRWVAGARDGWWTVFWIYNFAWGLAGLILLLPLLPTAGLMFMLRAEPAALAATGCIGLIATMLLMILVVIVTGMWTNRAIANWAADRSGASAALTAAWSAIKSDAGRHLLIALAILVVAMAGSSFFATFSMFAGLGRTMSDTVVFNLVSIPIRFGASILSTIFSALVSSWYLASYGALAVEAKER